MNLITTSSLLPAHANAGLALGKTYVGIDFGTSTTVVSIASYDAASNTIKTEALRLKQMLPDGTIHTAEIIPTVIAWMKEAERILVGKGASELMYEFTKGKNIWYWFKMELGVDLGAEYPQSEIADRAPFYIKNPKDCARVFFSYLKFLIAQYCEDNNLSDDIAYAVSVPASFEANQRKDLIDALTANDMKIAKQALIDEPNAAFISYVMGRAANGEPMSLSQGYNPKVLVFDFGAGTCDISILEIGVDVKGFYSKNISLSKFENCGGSDIDRYITYHYLMPRFLAENGKMMDDFITKDKKLIASRLFKIAENLKERVNKNLALLASDFNLPSVANSEVKTTIENHVSVFTNKGELKAKDFYLTNKEMAETMKVFLKTGYGKTTTINREEPYNSVFGPIDSAVKKARVSRDEIDYVLFIGGSAKSPYVQAAVKEYFSDSEMLLPADLQTHVSQGAAIHSLLYNGFGKSVIQPITSEPIIVVTKDEIPKSLIAAGTLIPTNTITINDLVTNREGQKTVELPLCIGNTSKMLFNLTVKAPSSKGFPANTPVELYLDIDSDKSLHVKARVRGAECTAQPLNPFANKELSTAERIALEAERAYNLECLRNGGVASRQSLDILMDAYREAGNNFKAAETAEEMKSSYPNAIDYNRIGVYYANAGCEDKAVEFYELAIQENPNHKYANANLGVHIRHKDPKRARACFEKSLKLDPDHDIALIELARMDAAEGKHEEAERKRRRVFDQYMEQWQAGDLPDHAYSWFPSVAEELGEYDIARQVRAEKKEKNEEFFDDENLAKTRNDLLPY